MKILPTALLPLVNPFWNKVKLLWCNNSPLAYKLLFLNMFSPKLMVVKSHYSYRAPLWFAFLINWLYYCNFHSFVNYLLILITGNIFIDISVFNNQRLHATTDISSHPLSLLLFIPMVTSFSYCIVKPSFSSSAWSGSKIWTSFGNSPLSSFENNVQRCLKHLSAFKISVFKRFFEMFFTVCQTFLTTFCWIEWSGCSDLFFF